MPMMKSRDARRLGVVINYASVTSLAVVVCWGEYGSWNGVLGLLGAAALFVAVLSFATTYGRSGFWKMAHADARDLDERQLEITHACFKRSYVAFGVVSMLLLIVIVACVRFSVFTLTFRGHYSFGLVAMVFLNYLINILPSSFLAWNEKSIPV